MSKPVIVRRGRKKPVIRAFKLGGGLPAPQDIWAELEQMRDVLLGHEDPPIDAGISTLMEVAEGYFSRACDIEQRILHAESEGSIPKGSDYHTLRTQAIRSFKEMSKSAAELGSRRITAANQLFERERLGRESG